MHIFGERNFFLKLMILINIVSRKSVINRKRNAAIFDKNDCLVPFRGAIRYTTPKKANLGNFLRRNYETNHFEPFYGFIFNI